MSPQAVRPLALTAMVGGALYVVVGLVQLTSPEQTDPFSRTSDYLIQLLLVLSLLLTLAGFVALHLLLQEGGYRGVRGWTGFRAAVIGQGAMLAAAAVSLATGGLTLGFSISPGFSFSSWGLRCSPSLPTGRGSCRIGALTWWALSPRSSSEGSGPSWSDWPGSRWLTSSGREGMRERGR
jgi:hypothetical protein